MGKSLRQFLLQAPLLAFCFAACSTNSVPTPVVGASALSGFSPESVTEMEISMRPPSQAAWRVRLKRSEQTDGWLVEGGSSDFSEASDLADSALVEHFLKTLTTFTTEAKADRGTDEIFGFTPYRVEMRIKSKTEAGGPEKSTLLLLGDPTGNTGIFFRCGTNAPTFVGRGALVAFLGHLQSPAAFNLKSPFLGRYEEYARIELEKHEGKGKGRWAIIREGDHWREASGGLSPGRILTSAQQALIERILHQRILRISEPAPLEKPDWTLRIVATNAQIPPQEIGIFFVLNQGFAINPQRAKVPLELYPEFAGVLRLFTQSGVTPVKSGIK